MFTGIVQGTSRVSRVEDHGGLRSLWLELGERSEGLQIGASVSVSGACLTAVEVAGGVVRFDCIDETLRRTTLGRLGPGALVNVERAARFGDEVGGHFLSGHVFEIGEVAARAEVGENLTLTLRVSAEALTCILPKGYVAVDGTSLTVGAVDPPARTFQVHLIPETRRATTLDALRPGDAVNIELDAMTQAVVATVERVLAGRGRAD